MLAGDRHGNLFWRNGAGVNSSHIASEHGLEPLFRAGPGLARESAGLLHSSISHPRGRQLLARRARCSATLAHSHPRRGSTSGLHYQRPQLRERERENHRW